MVGDDELFAAWRAGNPRAGEQLFERHYEPVARFFFNKVGDEGPDLIQRTFLACIEGRARFRGETGFRSYLFSIAYKMLCKHYYQRRRESEAVEGGESLAVAELAVADLGVTPTGLLAVEDEQRVLLHALRRLPLELQVILELHYWESLTAEDVAEIVSAPLGTVKTRIRRARQLLREQIEQVAGSPELLHSTLNNLDRWASGVGEALRRSA